MMKKKQSLTETLRDFASGGQSESDFKSLEHIVRSADLCTIVRQALSSSTATVRDVSIRREPAGVGLGTTVRVVEGTADEDGEMRPWTIILKLFTRKPGLEDERNPFYWKREAAFFSSSLPQKISVGLRPPRCFAVQSISDDAIALWLEYVPHRTTLWPDELLYRAARRVGHFSGHWYQVDHGLCERWMNDQGGFLEPWFPMADEWLDVIEARWQRCQEMGVPFADHFLSQLRSSWQRCKTYVQIYKAAPKTLCHFDVHQDNLFWNDEEHEDLVAIDWTFVGPGALGHDIVVMIFHRLKPGKGLVHARLREFSENVYSHYVDGLREVGWDGPSDEIRVGYLAPAAICWTYLTVVALGRALHGYASEQVTTDMPQDNVNYLWEYARQCISELETLTG